MKKNTFFYWVIIIAICLGEGLLSRKLGITGSYIESLSTGGYIVYMLGVIAVMWINYITFASLAKYFFMDND